MCSNTLLLFLIVHFVSDYSYGQINETFFRNDYKYIEATNSFYKIHPTRKTWADARRTCALEEASLFYPVDDKEAHEVISYWNRTRTDSFFVGISDLIVEGVFDTIDGKLVSDVYNVWGLNEPNDAGGEDCVAMNRDRSYNDVPCTNTFPFLCKKSLQSLEWNYDCNMPNLDYVFKEDVGSCYKFHMTPLTWTEAYAVCRAEQSQLAVISSRPEGEYLMRLTKTYPKQIILGNNDIQAVHLGFHNIFKEGWQTVKGTKLNSWNFPFWINGQPNEAVKEHCGSMLYTGYLNSISCDTKSYFICEHEVHKSPI